MDRIISVQILYYVEGKAEPLSLLLHKRYAKKEMEGK